MSMRGWCPAVARRRRLCSPSGMADMDGVRVAKLIDLVRVRPVLWDRQEEVYKNRKMTKRAWEDICRDLLENYADLPDEEQKAFVRNVVGKWANLRDNWLRYWRKRQEHIRAGSLTSKFKKYIHHDQLMFLSKVYDDQVAEMEQEVEEIQVEVDVLSDPGSESPLGFSSEEASQTSWRMGTSPVQVAQTPWPVPVVRETPLPPVLPLTEERHMYFFHSTLPLIADFDENQVLDFHAAVLESIKRIKSGKLPMSMVQTTQPAYILAIAQPPTFLANAGTTPKPLINTTSKDSSNETVSKEECHEVKEGNKSSIDSKRLNETNPILKTETKIREPKIDKPTDEETKKDLNSIVNKLGEISKTFENALSGDSFDQFGKYIGSFLRTLSYKRACLLKRRIVRQALRVQLMDKKNPSQPLKPLESLNQKRKPEVTTKTLLSEERVSSSSLENSVPHKTTSNNTTQQAVVYPKIIIRTGSGSDPVYESLSSQLPVPSHPKSPLLKSPVCNSTYNSVVDLHSHYTTQQKDVEPMQQQLPEVPVKRKRGRPRKYNPDTNL